MQATQYNTFQTYNFESYFNNQVLNFNSNSQFLEQQTSSQFKLNEIENEKMVNSLNFDQINGYCEDSPTHFNKFFVMRQQGEIGHAHHQIIFEDLSLYSRDENSLQSCQYSSSQTDSTPMQFKLNEKQLVYQSDLTTRSHDPITLYHQTNNIFRVTKKQNTPQKSTQKQFDGEFITQISAYEDSNDGVLLKKHLNVESRSCSREFENFHSSEISQLKKIPQNDNYIPINTNSQMEKRSQLISQEIVFCYHNRADNVFKSILRLMRKTYLEQFNKSSGFLKKKRNQQPEFFIQVLGEYIDTTIIENSIMDPESKTQLRESLSFFLGSLFYPKIIEQIYKSSHQRMHIETIRKALYSFTISKLDLLQQWDAYRYLLKHFINNYSNIILNSCDKIQEKKSDYEKAINFISKYYIQDQ
eukprot:403365231